MPSGPITLEHVARAAGVSPSTASRALTGKARQGRISESTEKAVLLAASGLGYRPSYVARSLRTQRSDLIGVVVPDASNPFFAAIARAATLAAQKQGLSTLLADSHDSVEHEKELLAHLQSRQVEGLIICPTGESCAHLEPLEGSGANIVVVDRWFSDRRFTTVTSENERGAYLATNAIIAQGHREIGCVQGRPGTSSSDERVVGFKEAMRDNKLVPKATLIRGDDFSEASGYRSSCELLEAHPELTAIFAFGNQNALGVLRALSERKLEVPQDISLVMYDDTPFAEFMASPLSVIRQDVATMGSKAAELLLKQLSTGRKPRKLLHRVPVEFLSRASIAPPRK